MTKSKPRSFYHTGYCPACGSGRIHVVKSEAPRRTRKCRVCGALWHTAEVLADGPWLVNLIREMLHTGKLTGIDLKSINHLGSLASRATGGAPLKIKK